MERFIQNFVEVSLYDALNRNITVINALNETSTYTYDSDGNLISQKDYLGNVTKNVYDGINRSRWGSIIWQKGHGVR